MMRQMIGQYDYEKMRKIREFLVSKLGSISS